MRGLSRGEDGARISVLVESVEVFLLLVLPLHLLPHLRADSGIERVGETPIRILGMHHKSDGEASAPISRAPPKIIEAIASSLLFLTEFL